MDQIKEKYQGKYRIDSARLKQWDYSSGGAYFITICTMTREYFLGDIIEGKMIETEQSKICMACWLDIPNYYKNCQLDEFVIMPNHVHGIIHINNSVEAIHELPQNNETIRESSLRKRLDKQKQRRNMLIPKIIGRFKMRTAKLINQYQKTKGIPFWQKNYYERIIRDEQELSRIREYIINNPEKWNLDKNNPENLYM